MDRVLTETCNGLPLQIDGQTVVRLGLSIQYIFQVLQTPLHCQVLAFSSMLHGFFEMRMYLHWTCSRLDDNMLGHSQILFGYNLTIVL